MLLGAGPDGQPYIQTVPRQGYRFAGSVTTVAARVSDSVLDELLAPHRAWVEGRAALETLERDQIVRARRVFEGVLEHAADHAPAHIGLANACVMHFEMTRADERPDVASLEAATQHSREACRLAPDYGEAWATLGFVLDRTGQSVDALAASRRAVTLEPDNWRHHFRLAYVGWGEERLRAAHRTLALLPGFPLAHWLIATVHVARHALTEAERQLALGIASQLEPISGARRGSAPWPFTGCEVSSASHCGDKDGALEAFERELASEGDGHLYGRECCANTWYAIGALRMQQGDRDSAAAAFREALARVAVHPLARLGLAALGTSDAAAMPSARPTSVDGALGHAIALACAGKHSDAARIVDQALAAAPPGNAGWLLPVEPMLQVSSHPDIWASALARLRTRAA